MSVRTTNMTLKPTNLLHLCDDIQEKIGKEIKCIRIEKDAKKRREFLHTYIIRSAYTGMGVARFCNVVIKFDFEEAIHDKMHDILIHGLSLDEIILIHDLSLDEIYDFFVATMGGVLYTQMKEKSSFIAYAMK